MAKPNYSFEKRQRELAKKKKQDEKQAKKASRTSSDAPQPQDGPAGTEAGAGDREHKA